MSYSKAVEDEETLTVETVDAVSREIAASHDPRLRVLGVASTDGESGRVELLVTIRGCHRDPCVIMLNLTRVGHAAFERELREKFRRALASHVAAS
jgi:hypothetical protein